MVRLVSFGLLLIIVVGAIGKEVPIPENNSIDDQLTDVKADIPYDFPVDDDSGIIPSSGNFVIQILPYTPYAQP